MVCSGYRGRGTPRSPPWPSTTARWTRSSGPRDSSPSQSACGELKLLVTDQYILVMLALTEAHCQLQLCSVRIIHLSMRPIPCLKYKHIIYFYFAKNILIQIKFMF